MCVRLHLQGQVKATSTVTTWGSVTSQVLALRDQLITEGVTLVVMEATSDYWKPFYYLLEEGPFEIMLVNPRYVKNLPGRKTDVSEAAWLAQPFACNAWISTSCSYEINDSLLRKVDYFQLSQIRNPTNCEITSNCVLQLCGDV